MNTVNKGADYGAARQEQMRKSKKKIHKCNEGGHAEGWHDRRGFLG